MFKKFCLGVVVAVGFTCLSFSDDQQTVKQLENEIIQLRQSFWQDGVRAVSDQEYDQLISQLRALSPTNPLLKEGAERRKIDQKHKIKHQKPMRSLRKCYTKSELMAWCQQVARTPNEKFTIEPKYDGVAVEFNNGNLSTRGDGEFGANISQISSILRYFPKRPNNRAVGELLLSDGMFNKLQQIDQKYVSSRHAVVAMLSSKSVDFWKKHQIVFDFVCYDYVQKTFTKDQLNQNWKNIGRWIQTTGYLTDGFVVKISDKTYYNSLGCTQAYPKGAMAFKWSYERKWAKLKGVDWQQGKKGFYPVGILSKVNLNGKCVTRVSLGSLANIRKKKLTVGSSLQIECVGGTVPVVKNYKIETNGKKIELINCPDCHKPVQLINDHYVCTNQTCPAKVVNEIYAKLKKKEVKGFGKKTILLLVDELRLKSWNDLKNKNLQELESVKGIGRTKAKVLLKATQK